MRYLFAMLFVAGLSGAAAQAGDHDHEHGHSHAGDLEVGKDGSGAIAVEGDLDEAFELPPVDGPLLFGCALDDPGFLSIEEDEPAEDLFAIPAGTEILFELVAIDPGLLIYSPGFADTLDTPGQSFSLGTVPFDTHPTWHIDSTDPAWNPNGTYSVTFRLVDASGTCDPSPDLTASVTCGEPGACCLPDGECEDGEFEGACEEEGGEFLGGGSVCSEDACEHTGACCLPTGECEEEHEDHCLEEGGVFLGEDTTCTENACTSVPTVSTWGLMVLALVLAAAGKLVWSRQALA